MVLYIFCRFFFGLVWFYSGFTGFLMHPGPMNIDSEITKDVANSKNSLVLRQVENGLYLRAALLSLIL